MAYSNKVIKNPKTGQTIQFIKTAQDTNGKLLEMESTYPGVSKEPLPHYHPLQEEKFKVIEGILHVRLDSEIKVLKKGDEITIAPGQVHAMWNNENSKTVVNWRVRPALNTEYFLETTTGLVNDDKTNDDGVPSLLQVALLSNRYSPVFRLAKPPHLLQRLVFVLLTPLAYGLGYRATYPRYLN